MNPKSLLLGRHLQQAPFIIPKLSKVPTTPISTCLVTSRMWDYTHTPKANLGCSLSQVWDQRSCLVGMSKATFRKIRGVAIFTISSCTISFTTPPKPVRSVCRPKGLFREYLKQRMKSTPTEINGTFAKLGFFLFLFSYLFW